MREVGAMAFSHCVSLKKISIPTSVTTIESGAFYHCDNLKEFHCKNSTPIGFESTSNTDLLFCGVDKSKCILLVPKGSKKAYQSAYVWKDFENIVEEEILVH